jgi:hypothetical protein
VHHIYGHFLLSSDIFSPKGIAVSEGPYVSLGSRLIAAADVPVILAVALRPATRLTNHRPYHCSLQVLGVVTRQQQ